MTETLAAPSPSLSLLLPATTLSGSPRVLCPIPRSRLRMLDLASWSTTETRMENGHRRRESWSIWISSLRSGRLAMILLSTRSRPANKVGGGPVEGVGLCWCMDLCSSQKIIMSRRVSLCKHIRCGVVWLKYMLNVNLSIDVWMFPVFHSAPASTPIVPGNCLPASSYHSFLTLSLQVQKSPTFAWRGQKVVSRVIPKVQSYVAS
jgi:hypothetical protein